MANVLQPHIEFHPHPVSHAPSPFGFGFGLGTAASSAMVAAGWQAPVTLGHTNPLAFQQLASSVNQSYSVRAQKRRHEPEDEGEINRHAVSQDDSMDRSPTPERPKRAAPKRARVAPVGNTPSKHGTSTKENKASTGEVDVDVGVLLASLPPQSLLPLLMSLLDAQPSLKTTILPLIPRPTLDTAIQALAQSAKKLRDAYPYSTVSSFSPSGSSTAFGFGRLQPLQNVPSSHQSHPSNGGMRDSYIISRLRPHITEFVAAVSSYLPYFSYIPPSAMSRSSSDSHQQPSQYPSTTLQTLHKDKPHPSETFLFLSAVTNHILSQPPLTQTSLGPLIIPRLSEEWNAWINRVDEVVNRQGGMFGSETVRSWERGLDEMADAKGFEGTEVMRAVRFKWISKVGWLVGRVMQQPMEEL